MKTIILALLLISSPVFADNGNAAVNFEMLDTREVEKLTEKVEKTNEDLKLILKEIERQQNLKTTTGE